jgi:hypothetical protein
VPLDNFYEWAKTPTGKQPYAIGLAHGGLMAMAGCGRPGARPKANGSAASRSRRRHSTVVIYDADLLDPRTIFCAARPFEWSRTLPTEFEPFNLVDVAVFCDSYDTHTASVSYFAYIRLERG